VGLSVLGGCLRSGVRQILKIGLGAAASLLLSGCQLYDSATLEPRHYEVNLGSQNVREELTLLNVVRASRFEPMNFTALSKYTASGSLTAGGQAATTIAKAGQSVLTGGPASGSTANSFDLVPLDFNEFYDKFLATLDPSYVHIFINAGLSREVVFNSLIDSIDVQLTPAGQRRLWRPFPKLRFRNDPSYDTWFGKSGPEAFEQCALAAEEDYQKARALNTTRPIPVWAPFYTDFWYSKDHFNDEINDCNYHKFLLLIRAAFEFGVTTAKANRDNSPASSGTAKASAVNKPKQAANKTSPNPAGSAQPAASGQQPDIILCFDPAIAAVYGNVLQGQFRCPEGGKLKPGDETLLNQPLKTELGLYDAKMEPVLRSAYGVFLYYGQLLRDDIQVEISTKSGRITHDHWLFRVTKNIAGCFVRVTYGGRSYCVPEKDAANTKEVLTILLALVNMSTPANLPKTQSVIANP
jgi:hypothetical protein